MDPVAVLREQVTKAKNTMAQIWGLVLKNPSNSSFQKALNMVVLDLANAKVALAKAERSSGAVGRIPDMWKPCDTAGNCTGCRSHATPRYQHPAALKGGKYCTDCRNHLNSTNIKWVNRTGSCGLQCTGCKKSGEQLRIENVRLVTTFDDHGVLICGECLP